MREITTPHSSEAAFASLLDRVQRPLYSFVLGMLHEEELAHDLVQDVFCDAWRAAQRGAPPFGGTDAGDEQAARRWLFHTAYCRAISQRRRHRLLHWSSLDADDVQAVAHPKEPAPFEDQVIEGEVLRAALARLAPEDAACLLLNVVQGFTSSEIAQIVGLKSETAKKRLTRAKERLRAAYFAENA